METTRRALALVLAACTAGCGVTNTVTQRTCERRCNSTTDSGVCVSWCGRCLGDCLPEPPEGFDRPSLLWVGGARDTPDCPPEAPVTVLLGYLDPDAQLDCPPCSCSEPTCGPPDELQISSSATCDGDDLAPYDAPDILSGACAAPGAGLSTGRKSLLVNPPEVGACEPIVVSPPGTAHRLLAVGAHRKGVWGCAPRVHVPRSVGNLRAVRHHGALLAVHPVPRRRRGDLPAGVPGSAGGLRQDGGRTRMHAVHLRPSDRQQLHPGAEHLPGRRVQRSDRYQRGVAARRGLHRADARSSPAEHPGDLARQRSRQLRAERRGAHRRDPHEGAERLLLRGSPGRTGGVTVSNRPSASP
ncbi:uncharacterized protein SOCE26_028360 [Sorangium cellulosum]|uniref:Uncharacterized protein n=1 Tax=Sorangium cellulosum TaxID=56 RepID=A0A2L0EQ56_SORCE|nr:uncharacterized protein SOCE26_028360 [Sorangium cellulosum]